jgi:hypothetical protein
MLLHRQYAAGKNSSTGHAKSLTAAACVHVPPGARHAVTSCMMQARISFVAWLLTGMFNSPQCWTYLWTGETEEACSADHCYWSAATMLVLLQLRTRGPCITAAAGFNCKLHASWFACCLQARGGWPTCWLITLCLSLLLIPATTAARQRCQDVPALNMHSQLLQKGTYHGR